MEKISVKIDYKELLVNFWKTNHENPRGIFYIHHGMAEHIDRYESFAEKLNSFGFHVVGHNHLGHGDNKENGEGIFAPSKGWSKVCNEACMVNEYFSNLYPKLPSYVFGHSMGAFITISSLKRIKNLKGIFLTGTFLPSKAQLFLMKILLYIEKIIFRINDDSQIHKINFQRLNSVFKNPRTDFDWLARDMKVVDKYIDDPNCGFNCSNSLWLDFVHGGELVLRSDTFVNLSKDIKIFLAAGADDPCIINGGGIDGLYEYLKKRFNNVDIKKFEGMRHEIQNEPSKNELLSLIDKFLLE
jgi:alpha-beta hydrolase superfamily lysophospholipase